MIAAALALGIAAAGVAWGKNTPLPELRAFSPEADTYVSKARPQRNFGSLEALRADSVPQATVYLRFRIRKLKGSITRVALLLHAQGKARAIYQVRRVDENDWREAGLTYENAPKLSLRYASSKPVRRGAWSAVDVTPLVSGGGRVSLAITTKSALGVVFASRESNHGPRLVVRTDAERVEEPEP